MKTCGVTLERTDWRKLMQERKQGPGLQREQSVVYRADEQIVLMQSAWKDVMRRQAAESVLECLNESSQILSQLFRAALVTVCVWWVCEHVSGVNKAEEESLQVSGCYPCPASLLWLAGGSERHRPHKQLKALINQSYLRESIHPLWQAESETRANDELQTLSFSPILSPVLIHSGLFSMILSPAAI